MKTGKARRTSTANENATERSFGARTIVRSIVAVMRAAQDTWRDNRSAQIAAITGTTVRSGENIMAGKKGLSADGLACLLAAPDIGPRIFREFTPAMDDKTLAAYAREIEAARIRLQRAALDRRMESIERES